MTAECDGWVKTLRDQTLVFTGKVLVDGEWTFRSTCADLAATLGAKETKTDFSRKVTLVVFGDLATQSVSDPERHYSQKLVGAARERDRGHHACVVDAEGFSDLLDGWLARCRDLERPRSNVNNVVVLPQVGDGVLGGPLSAKSVGQHDQELLATDLSHLDKGTAAHEATLAALGAHLERQGIQARGHARGGPQFDAGWTRDDVVHIAEVKSLTGASEDQQIRLGMGQVLDYFHQLESLPTYGSIRPVLVLEKQPRDARWVGLFQSRDVLLTWAPEFPGC